MALDTARLVQSIQKGKGALTLLVDVIYYDSTDPPSLFTIADPKTLHYHTFFFDAGTAAADMLASIRSEGATARAAIARAATIAASNPVNTTWTIP